MFRLVLAVVLAAALLGVSLPVVDTARVSHAEANTETAIQRLDTAATTLANENDAVAPRREGARRQHVLRLPQRSWGSAGIDALRFPPPGTDRPPTWRVTGGNWTPIDASVPLVGPPDGLTLESGGRHRLTLRYRRSGDRAVVVVTRADV